MNFAIFTFLERKDIFPTWAYNFRPLLFKFSMAKEVWKEYYPTEWHDDQSMDVLFSHFRQNREINPQSWDKKLLFWSNMVKEELMYTKRVSFDAKTLPYAFIRRGSVPKCLPTVLQEMIRWIDIFKF